VAHCGPRQFDLKERILLRELNHRINNELASVIGVVSTGAVLADSAEVKAALSSVVELLHKYADVHHALATPVTGALVDAAEYLRKLGLAMSRCTLERMNIKLVLAANAFPLEAERCWQLGLIMQELVTNASRHASFGNANAEIRIELKRAGSSMRCIVSDNGSATAALKPGRGRTIIADLTKVLGGWIHYKWTTESKLVVLVFPLTQREQRANGANDWLRNRVRRSVKIKRSLSRSSTNGRSREKKSEEKSSISL
jgi:two-component sensor histidine kinase